MGDGGGWVLVGSRGGVWWMRVGKLGSLQVNTERGSVFRVGSWERRPHQAAPITQVENEFEEIISDKFVS